MFIKFKMISSTILMHSWRFNFRKLDVKNMFHTFKNNLKLNIKLIDDFFECNIIIIKFKVK